MDDGRKIAAAILAAEASRQSQANKPTAAQGTGYDIAGGLLGNYRYFLEQIAKESSQA